MKLSIALRDASFREMLHTPIYLNKQKNVNRKDYEIIWMELYDKETPMLKEYKDKGILDKYIILRQSRTQYIRLSLLYNEAILQSEGDIFCIMDGDAICSPNFVSSIISSFEQFKNIILYIDEVRHAPPEWCWPVVKEWDEIIRIRGYVNWHNWDNDRSTGVSELIGRYGNTFLDINNICPTMTHKNYGACLSALKRDLVMVGGFEEHEGFDGVYTGPWEVGWRLLPFGFKEYWHPTEFLIHPYHPYTDGHEAKFPPRPDGCVYMNPYATNRLIDSISSPPLTDEQRILKSLPWVENEKIKAARLGLR